MSEDIQDYRREALIKATDLMKRFHILDLIDTNKHNMLLTCIQILYVTDNVKAINLTIGLMQDMIIMWEV